MPSSYICTQVRKPIKIFFEKNISISYPFCSILFIACGPWSPRYIVSYTLSTPVDAIELSAHFLKKSSYDDTAYSYCHTLVTSHSSIRHTPKIGPKMLYTIFSLTNTHDRHVFSSLVCV